MTQSQIYVPPKIIHTSETGIKTVYLRNEELGHGGFAVVYRVTQQNTSKCYAMKVISKERYASSKGKASLEKLKSEMQIQKSLNHQNIVRSRISFSDQFNYYIILDYCPGKSVRDYIRKSNNSRLNEQETRKILNDVIRGLVYLHNRQIIHHDLKLENFLIGYDGKVKIADFGLSTIYNDDDDSIPSICGTPNYMSPEILKKEKSANGFKTDVWAIGIAAFIMLTGRAPFDGGNKHNTFEKIKNNDFVFPSNVKLTFEAKDFIIKTLRKDPSKRPTAIDLIDHPFLTKFDNEHIQLYNQPIEKVQPILSTLPSQKVQSILPKSSAIQNPINIPRRLTSSLNNNPIIGSRIMTIPSPVRSRSSINYNGNRNCSINAPTFTSSKNSDENENSLKKSCLNSSIKVSNTNQCPHENYHSNNINSNIKKNYNIPNYFVSRHCFYNEDLGYLLANGTVGVCFEDRSRIVMDPNEEFVQYYKNYTSFHEVFKLDEFLDSTDDCDKMMKKISLVKKFARIFKKLKLLYELERTEYDSSLPLHNVKYFVKKDDSILFKLNNKNIQANFGDKKKMIILWQTKRTCLFSSIKEKCNLLNLNDVVMDSNCEEYKKYKEIKILLSMLSKKI